MMKKLLLLLILLITTQLGFGQITVDDTFTVQELVEDVLIEGACASVSNFNSDTGTNGVNGIGYFNANGSDFPFAEGIILSTGEATNAPGPNNSTLSDDSNAPGDPDLDAAVPADNPRFDRSLIEFDFVPLVEFISFNFLFASEEYDMNFECDFSDAFAFLLTDSNGNTTNLAVLPGVPPPNNVVSATNVHPEIDGPFGCDAINEDFFGQYNLGADAADSPTNFNGQTVSITASSAVNAGETYRIKLVIADESDSLFDSAVFLEGGSFDLGADLGEDITIDAGNASCDNEPVVLDVTENAQFSQSVAWFQDGNLLPDEIGATLTVTEAGTYTVEITYSDDCVATDDIVVEFFPAPVIANEPQNLLACEADISNTEFDLTENNDDILGAQNPSDFTITYYETSEDAMMDNNAIPNPEAYQATSNPQSIFVRIDDAFTGMCFDTSSFEISAFVASIGSLDDLFECNDDSTDSEFDLTENDQNALNAQNPNNFTVTYHTTQADADTGDDSIVNPEAFMNSENQQIIFTRVENNQNPDCFQTSQFQLFEAPAVNLGEDFATCFDEPETLNATPSNYDSADVTYEWTLDGVTITDETDATLEVTELGAYTVIVTFNASCSASEEIVISEGESPNIDLGEDFATCFDEPESLNATPSNYDDADVTYEWALNGNTIAGETDATLNINQIGTYTATVTTGNGVCEGMDSITVTPDSTLEVSINNTSEVFGCGGENVILSAITDEANVTYQWLDEDGNPLPGETDSTYEAEVPVNQETRIIQVEISTGICTGMASIELTRYAVDNCNITEGISPNADGLNDCLDLTFLSERTGISSLEMFNRYGRSVYQQNNYVNEWCGQTDDGEDLPTGTYYYVLKLSGDDDVFDGVETGWIYVNRPSN